jgi:hypothetical protein
MTFMFVWASDSIRLTRRFALVLVDHGNAKGPPCAGRAGEDVREDGVEDDAGQEHDGQRRLGTTQNPQAIAGDEEDDAD